MSEVYAQSVSNAVLTPSQYVLKLDGKSPNISNVPFDVSIFIQVFSNDSIKSKDITYWKIKGHFFNRQSPKGYLELNKTLYNKLYESKPNHVVLTPNDTFQLNSDVTGPKFVMNVSHPIYFESNSHYFFIVLKSLRANLTYFVPIKMLLLQLMQIHEDLKGNTSFFTAEQKLIATIKLVNSTKYKSAKDLINAEKHIIDQWELLKKEITSNSDKDKFESILKSYKAIYLNFIAGNSSLASIPSVKESGLDIDSAGQFFKVYDLAINLLSDYESAVYNLSKLQSVSTIFSCDPAICLSYLLKLNAKAQQCCCVNTIGAQLKDSTNIAGLLVELADPKETTNLLSFINDESNQLKRLLAMNNLQIDNKYLSNLNSLKNQFISIYKIVQNQSLTDFHFACDESVLVDLKDLIAKIQNNIDIFNSIIKILSNMDEIIDADGHFNTIKFYSGDSYTNSVTSRNGFKLTTDIGIIDYGINGFLPGYSDNLQRITPYFGIHINWKYLNSDVPFKNIPHNNFFSGRHFSTFIGFTIFSIKESGKIDNLFNKSALLIGMGYRITPGLRVVVGGLSVKKNNPNPLVLNTKFGIIPFAGLSFDFNSIFTNLTSLLK